MNAPSLTETNLPKVIQAIRDLAVGRSNAVSPIEIALTVGQTETTVKDERCADSTVPLLVPTSSAGAKSGWYVKSVAPGAFLIGHDIAPAGCLFRYELRRN
jgi:hypothetical protein